MSGKTFTTILHYPLWWEISLPNIFPLYSIQNCGCGRDLCDFRSPLQICHTSSSYPTCFFLPSPLYTQWKNAPKGQLMDSKLRCVFVEGEAPAATTQKAEERPATPVRWQIFGTSLIYRANFSSSKLMSLKNINLLLYEDGAQVHGTLYKDC